MGIWTTFKTRPKSYAHHLALFVIVVTSFFLRFHNLDKESLWFDEGNAIRLSVVDFNTFLKEGLVQAPLYFKLLKYWTALFGNSAFALRFLSLIFGVLAVLAIYKVGELLFDRETGLLSALLAGLSPFQIQYSQEVKYYSLLMLLTLLSFYYLLRQFSRARLSDFILYFLCNAALLYIHNYAIFVLAAQNIYFFTMLAFSKTGKLKAPKWLALQFMLALVYLPWSIIVARQVKTISGTYWLPRTGLSYLVLTFILLAGSTKLLKLTLPLVALAIWKVDLKADKLSPVNPVKSYQGINLRKWFVDRDRTYLLLLWLFIPVLVPFIISQFVIPIYHYRYTIVASGALFLLIAKAVRSIGTRLIRLPVAALVIVLYALALKGYYADFHKEPWREVVAYIETNAQAGDLVLVHQYHCLVNIVNYYSKRTDLDKKAIPENEDTVNSRNIAELEPAVQGYNNVWLIMSHKDDPEDLILSNLNQLMELILYKQYYGIELYLFLRKK